MTGKDIILNLLADVAELKENSIETTRHLEALVKISRDSSRRIERTAVTLAKLADLFTDHEARISALETRE